MLNRLLYFVLLLPATFLPLRLMYLFTDFFYLCLITILPYRRKVVRSNIAKSFPDLTDAERRKIERKFYRHLTDLLAEAAKSLSISKNQLLERFRVVNPEIMQALYEKNKSVLLVSGHYNNWEWLILAQDLLFPHKAVGVGTPLSSSFWDLKLTERRSRFGMHVIHANHVKVFYEKMKGQPLATLLLADQSPTDARRSYWMDFLNQPTAVFFGPEALAHQLDHAVVFFHIRKVKRGYYEMELSLITERPKSLEWGEITEKHTRLLEKVIEEEPSYWIWSHKRWKKEVPSDLTELKKMQKERFDKKR
ncbi:MAG: lysophospholipid acyltransferase family protein [Crocinitomicaceae bacterium]|nr:lysophospholipid acyltransferase family protein [Crocinitomicaceae bacterium]